MSPHGSLHPRYPIKWSWEIGTPCLIFFRPQTKQGRFQAVVERYAPLSPLNTCLRCQNYGVYCQAYDDDSDHIAQHTNEVDTFAGDNRMSNNDYTQAEREEIVTLARGLAKALGPRKAHLLTNVMRSVLGVEYNRGQKIEGDPNDQEVERQIEIEKKKPSPK